jgi:hypothetical protein
MVHMKKYTKLATGYAYPVFLAVMLALATINAFTSSRPAAPKTAQPAVVMVTLDASLDRYAPMWQKEVSRRFPNAVGVLVHGGNFVEDEWIVGTAISPGHVTHVQSIVKHYQELYPGRTLVLLACNPGHLKLGIPGVYYAMSSVWCVPDRQVEGGGLFGRLKMSDGEVGESSLPAVLAARSEGDPDVVGNVFEFVAE